MVAIKKHKPKKIQKPKIEYPPVTTRKWIPPDQRPKPPKPEPAYVKPKEVTFKLKISSLKKVWNQFEILDDHGILLGHYSQTHKKYTYKTNGHQGACNCAMACVFANLNKMSQWSRTTLDQILDLGDALYLKTIQQPGETCFVEVPPEKVFNSIFLGRHKINFHIDDDLKIVGRVPSVAERKVMETFRESLDDFFQKYSSGIFSVTGKYLAVWLHDDAFYLFDPTEHQDDGELWKDIPGWGFSVVYRCKSVKTLVKQIYKNVSIPALNTTFEIYGFITERVVTIKVSPPETFEEICPVDKTETVLVEDEIQERPRINIVESKCQLHLQDNEDKTSLKIKILELSPIVNDSSASSGKRPSWIKEGPIDKSDYCTFPIPPKQLPKKISYYNDIIPEKVGILRGTTCQTDKKLSKYEGRQSMGNAISALMMLRLYNSSDWVPRIVNTILKNGDLLYRDAMVSIPRTQSLKLSNFQKKTEYEGKLFVPVVDDYCVVGKLNSQDYDVLDLGDALENFLVDNVCCVVVGPLTLATWIENGQYFMFDPNERDKDGKSIKPTLSYDADMIPIHSTPGCACVMWFQDLKDLIELYMSNVEKSKRSDTFYLSKVRIEDYVDLPENWYNFKGFEPGKWILRGTISQSNNKFSDVSRNLQSPAICLTALAFRTLVPLKEWTVATVDEVIHLGDNLYTDSVEALKSKEQFQKPFLMLSEILWKYKMKDKMVQFHVEECFLNGVVNSKNDNGIIDLRRGLRKYFEDNDLAVVTCRRLSFAVWKNENYYYYFDSHDRSENGLSTNFGTACIIRAIDLDDISTVIETNITPGTEDLFNINKITITFFEIGEGDTIEPPLNQYTKIDDGKAILRSLYSEISTKYGINAGKQTVPMCLVAMAFNRLKPALDWTKADLDEIINKGDNLYVQTMDGIQQIKNAQQLCDLKEEPKDGQLSEIKEEPGVENNTALTQIDGNGDSSSSASFKIVSDNVKTEFCLGFNKFDVEFEEVEKGNIKQQLVKSIKTLLTNPEENQDVTNKELLLESVPLTVYIWRDDNLFYVFDSKPRDKRGRAVNIEQWLEPSELDGKNAKTILKKSQPPLKEELTNDLELKLENDDENAAKEVKKEEDNDVEQETDVIDLGLLVEGEGAMMQYLGEGQEEEGAGAEEEDLLERHYPLVEKNSSYWLERAKAGKACTIWFTNLDDLADHVYKNIPAWRAKSEDFVLKLVKLRNTLELKNKYNPDHPMIDMYQGHWYFFKELDYGKWILRGTMTVFSDLFPTKNRGKQDIPTCYMALVIAHTFGLICFNDFSVDSILCYGDKLFTYIKRRRKEQILGNNTKNLTSGEIDWLLQHEDVEIGDIPNKICISNFMVTVDTNRDAVLGDIKAQHFEDVLDLKRGLEKFFDTNKYGILQAKGLTVAIWRGQKTFYMFDGLSRGPSGTCTTYGTACVLRYLNLDHFANDFLQNVPQYGKNDFTIHSVCMSTEICPRQHQPTVEQDRTPQIKDGGFKEVIPGKRIVRGGFNQEHPKYGKKPNELSSTIAVVALSMTLLHKTKTWSPPIIDEILELGNELYEESKLYIADEFDPWEDKIDLEKIKKDFSLGSTKVNFELRLTTQSGIFDAKNSAVPNLRKCLEEFFEENTHGILVSEPLTLAIWEETNSDPIYYVLDPNPRSSTGMPLFSGTACLVSFVNTTIAANHIISTIEQPEQRNSTFTIFPVEIVIGNESTRKPKKVTTKCEINVLPRCSKLVANKNKRMLRKIAEEERKKKETKRLNQLGRKGFYTLPSGDAILRSNCTKTASTNDNTDITNSIVAVVMHNLDTVDRWNSNHLDLILDIGDQLYIDSYIAYGPDGSKLGLENIIRKFYMNNLGIHVIIYKPIVSEMFVVSKILNILQVFFQQETFCLFSYMNQWVALFFKTGLFYMFDPHLSDVQGGHVREGERGSAFLMRYKNLNSLAAVLFHNLFVATDTSARMFTLWLIDVDIRN